MLLALSGFVSCASLFAMEDDFKVGYPDDDETSYQNDDEEGFKVAIDESETLESENVGCGDCEKVGYIDDDPGQSC